MIRNLFGGASKCRTIDKVDIFGDSSGVALYQLDGNANDTGGNYHGTETAITYGGGVYERGAVFNGTSSVITTSALTVPSSPYTISAYVNPSSLGTLIAIAGTTATTSEKGFMFYKTAANTIGFLIAAGNGVATYTATSTTTLAAASYVHVVGTWDGTTNTNGIKVYINGILEGQGTSGVSAVTIGAWTRQVYIGNLVNQAYFNGSIDQVRIFNRAITATEVATLYAECAPTSTVDNINPFMDGSLKALYKFEGDATDATGVYNGTATNVTYGTGKFGQCFAGDGTLRYINTTYPNYPALLSTLSVWVKYVGGTTTHILASSTYSANNMMLFGVGISTAGNLHFQTRTGAGTQNLLVDSVANLGSGWNHICIVNNGADLKSYLNGVLKNTLVVSYGGAVGDAIRIGSSPALNESWNGSVEQFRIFNKALTPMEVAALYNETTPLEEPMYKLVDPFRDGSGKALYRLEGNALDESGNFNGTATSVTYGAGQFGRAVVNGIAATNINTTYLPTSTETYSISMWEKINGIGYSAITTLDGTGDNGWRFYGLRNDNTVSFLDQYGTGASFIKTTVAKTYDTNWHHYVLVFVANHTLYLYMDNVLIGTIVSNLATFKIPVALNIGKGSLGDATGKNFDQVRIFNRALTAGEVSTLYTSENSVI